MCKCSSCDNLSSYRLLRRKLQNKRLFMCLPSVAVFRGYRLQYQDKLLLELAIAHFDSKANRSNRTFIRSF